MSEKSAFYDPARERERYHRLLVFPPPPAVHMVAYVTGGLQTLYNNIHKKECKTSDGITHKLQSYTNDQGFFTPQIGMPLLAGRYKYITTVGKGQSSVIIKAVDTFQSDVLVAIKVLHLTCFLIGSQEANIMLELGQDDPFMCIPFVRLQNIFHFEDHYCLTFELLDPHPVTEWYKGLPYPKDIVIYLIYLVAVKLVNVLYFLNQKNIIHADLKPDNVLLGADKEIIDVKVVDFGNAIHCVYDELSLYYTDYELQTLSYRAPEVLVGVQVGPEVDMWSLGCILAELYTGEPLFPGQNKKEVLKKITSLLGPLPDELKNGKFFLQYQQHFGKPFTKLKIKQHLHEVLGFCEDWVYIDFLSQLLSLNPNDRLTPSAAHSHQFFISSSNSNFSSFLKGSDLTYQENEMKLILYEVPPNIVSKKFENKEPYVVQNQRKKHLICSPSPLSIVPMNHKVFVNLEIFTVMQSLRNHNHSVPCYAFFPLYHLDTFVKRREDSQYFFSGLFPFLKELLLVIKDKAAKENFNHLQECLQRKMHIVKWLVTTHINRQRKLPLSSTCFIQSFKNARKSYWHRNLKREKSCISYVIKLDFNNIHFSKKLLLKQTSNHGSWRKFLNFASCRCSKSSEECKRCLSLLKSNKIKCKFIFLKKTTMLPKNTMFASLREVY